MAYIRTLRENQMEVASEFLEMASRFFFIKAASLLPCYQKEEDPAPSWWASCWNTKAAKQARSPSAAADTGWSVFLPGRPCRWRSSPHLPPPSPHQRADQRLLVGLRQKGKRRLPRRKPPLPPGRRAYGFGGKPHYAPAAGLLPPGPGQPAKASGPITTTAASVVATFMAVLELLKAGRVHLTDDDTELVLPGGRKESGKLKSGFYPMNLTETRPKHEFDRFPKRRSLPSLFAAGGAAGNRPPGGKPWPSAMPKRQSSVLLQQRLAESDLPLSCADWKTAGSCAPLPAMIQ